MYMLLCFCFLDLRDPRDVDRMFLSCLEAEKKKKVGEMGGKFPLIDRRCQSVDC